MDFDQVLDRLEIAPDPFAVCELKCNCDVGLGQDTGATLHYILSGQGEIVLRDRPALSVSEGSLVLIPAMWHHRMRSSGLSHNPAPACQPAELELRRLLKDAPGGDSGSHIVALCAHLRVGLRGAPDIVDLIRAPLYGHIAEAEGLAPVLQALLKELSAPQPGSRAMIRALLTQCLIDLIRRRSSRDALGAGWMNVLRDPALWPSLRAMLDDPGAAHTVDSLAALSGMSRSSFAERFAAAYRIGPIELLRDLRIKKAGILLREGDLPVKRIAYFVGFSSRTAFTRMFERNTGVSPTDFRKGLGGSAPDGFD
ncbi:helix-turn-helix transcriptional regulator [Roseovarius rhodophyticola]|uniref:AraC family transcriptional regulator n=1 Tax=Roseovarius rhodophyticola TaxID=3080827 RepID=A0ABZ2TD09_9RHOB|nr:AraC family transcriptional regulator [Roseovarius sp. W115]MDV2931367.1 AraC family transcriptional regulator [Roseovarius sp. W115]